MKQTDYDGAYEYSDIIPVLYRSILTEAASIAVYPNPSNGENFQIMVTDMTFNENVILEITDMFGKNVMSKNMTTDLNGNLIHWINAPSNLMPGVYIVTVSGGGGKSLGKVGGKVM